MSISNKLIENASINDLTRAIYLNSNGYFYNVNFITQSQRMFSALNSDNGCTVTSSGSNEYKIQIPLPYIQLSASSVWYIFIYQGSSASSSTTQWIKLIGKGTKVEMALKSNLIYVQDDFYPIENSYGGYYAGSTFRFEINSTYDKLIIYQTGTNDIVNTALRTVIRLIKIGP